MSDKRPLTSHEVAISSEQVKARAAYFNNLAVAFTVTGLVAPIFTVSGNDMQIIRDCVSMWYHENPTTPHAVLVDGAYGAIFVIGAAFCGLLAFLFRKRSNKILKELPEQREAQSD